jgi:hypothetical protein
MQNNSSGGVGILGLLLVAFIILKITKLIDWSWWLVFLPAWIGIGFGILALVLAFAVIIRRVIKDARD